MAFAWPAKPRVPLNKKALKLVKKYKGVDKDGRLFPCISPQKYNEAIKKILLICGITRNVQIRDSRTSETRIERICDVASSHMARRIFVGAAYKAVRDPNIVGKMSGHVKGSRTFNRYRQIDEDILRETINENNHLKHICEERMLENSAVIYVHILCLLR